MSAWTQARVHVPEYRTVGSDGQVWLWEMTPAERRQNDVWLGQIAQGRQVTLQQRGRLCCAVHKFGSGTPCPVHSGTKWKDRHGVPISVH